MLHDGDLAWIASKLAMLARTHSKAATMSSMPKLPDVAKSFSPNPCKITEPERT